MFALPWELSDVEIFNSFLCKKIGAYRALQLALM